MSAGLCALSDKDYKEVSVEWNYSSFCYSSRLASSTSLVGVVRRFHYEYTCDYRRNMCMFIVILSQTIESPAPSILGGNFSHELVHRVIPVR